jgi:hypothetical protein
MATIRLRKLLSVAPLLALFVLAAPAARGQAALDPDLIARCQDAQLTSRQLALCQDVVASVQLLQPDLGIALASGNPVLGTASPIGTKFRFIPRVFIGGRINFVWAGIPDVLDYPDDPSTGVGTRSFSVPMPQIDVSVGVFDGFRVGSTASGLGSVELLGSLGPMILPAGEGFENDATGVGLGARIGLVRESFSAPGISISGEYQWTGRIRYGNVAQGDDAQFGMDMEAASFRLGLSKSFVSLGLALTIGWDHYQSEVDFGIAGSDGNLVAVVPQDSPASLSAGRWLAAVDVSYIVLFFNIALEAGWQEEQKLTTSSGDELTSGNFFCALGIRVSL